MRIDRKLTTFVRRIVGKVDGVLVSVEDKINRPSEDAARSKKFAQRCVKLREELRKETAARADFAKRYYKAKEELHAAELEVEAKAARVSERMQGRLDPVERKLKEAAAIVNRQNVELQEFRTSKWGYANYDLKEKLQKLNEENVRLQERAKAKAEQYDRICVSLRIALDDALDKNNKLEERTRVAELLTKKYRLEKSKAYTKLNEVMCGSIEVWVTRIAGADHVKIWREEPHWKNPNDHDDGGWTGLGGTWLAIKTDDPKGYKRIGRLDTIGPGS